MRIIMQIVSNGITIDRTLEFKKIKQLSAIIHDDYVDY